MPLPAPVPVPVPWYEIKFLHVLLGSLITIITFIITQIINSKREKQKQFQTMLNLIVQSNSSLFNIIFHGSIHKDKINYLRLREELVNNGGFIVLLPKDLKYDFEQLYKIHMTDSKYYEVNKHEIFGLLSSIVGKINKYGVQAFEY